MAARHERTASPKTTWLITTFTALAPPSRTNPEPVTKHIPSGRILTALLAGNRPLKRPETPAQPAYKQLITHRRYLVRGQAGGGHRGAGVPVPVTGGRRPGRPAVGDGVAAGPGIGLKERGGAGRAGGLAPTPSRAALGSPKRRPRPRPSARPWRTTRSAASGSHRRSCPPSRTPYGRNRRTPTASPPTPARRRPRGAGGQTPPASAASPDSRGTSSPRRTTPASGRTTAGSPGQQHRPRPSVKGT